MLRIEEEREPEAAEDLPRGRESILVVDDEPAIRLSIFREVFTKAAALCYLTESERQFVQRQFPDRPLLEELTGVGVDIPEPQPYPRMPPSPDEADADRPGGRDGDEQADQQLVHERMGIGFHQRGRRGAASLRTARSFAERLRGLVEISSSPGVSGRLVSGSANCVRRSCGVWSSAPAGWPGWRMRSGLCWRGWTRSCAARVKRPAALRVSLPRWCRARRAAQHDAALCKRNL